MAFTEWAVMTDTTSMPGATSTTTSALTGPMVISLIFPGMRLRALTFMALLLWVGG